METMTKSPNILNTPAPLFTGSAYHQGQEISIRLSDYKGKWVVLLFYGADLTFV